MWWRRPRPRRRRQQSSALGPPVDLETCALLAPAPSPPPPPPPLLLLLLLLLPAVHGGSRPCPRGCGEHGACVDGECVCVGGYRNLAKQGHAHSEENGGCSVPPDLCRYPSTVRCFGERRCVGGICVGPDACDGDVSESPCEHGQRGHCGVCVCHRGHSGLNCSDADECASGPCRNGGSCYHSAHVRPSDGDAHAQLAAAWRGHYVCACAVGYSGSTCACPDCGAHGSCDEGASRCVCAVGFAGELCEVDIDDCASAPCLHGGECLDAVGAFVCACGRGWRGPLCEVDVDECASAPCQNGGTCVESGSSGSVAAAAAAAAVEAPGTVVTNEPAPARLPGAGRYGCMCAVGWASSRSRPDCGEDVDECASAPCRHGGTCVESSALEAALASVMPEGRDAYHLALPSAVGADSYFCACVDGWCARVSAPPAVSSFV
jgi:hypothetical protein